MRLQLSPQYHNQQPQSQLFNRDNHQDLKFLRKLSEVGCSVQNGCISLNCARARGRSMVVSFFKHVCHTTQMTFSYNQLLEGCEKAKEKKQHQLPKMVCQHANIHAPWFIHNELCTMHCLPFSIWLFTVNTRPYFLI